MRSRISVQFIIAAVVISITAFGILSFVLITHQQRAMISQIKRHSTQCSETITSSTRYSMMHNQREELDGIICNIGRQPAISKVRILNKNGVIVYSSAQEEKGTAVDMEAEACLGCHGSVEAKVRLAEEDLSRFFEDDRGHPQLGVIRPIYNDPSCSEADCHAHPASQTVLGVLDITLHLDEVQQEMKQGRNTAVSLAAAAIFSTSFVLLYLFHTRVGRPVAELADATKRVAKGDLKTTIEVRRENELGQLEHSFNEMTRRLAETQNQLYQSDRLASVGRLAAGFAHEINNPLTAVLTFSSLLLKQAGDDPEAKESLETIVNETKRCRDIVKGLLDFSRRVPPRKRAVDLNQVVEDALQIVSHQLNVAGIEIEPTLAPDLPTVKADPNQLQQVLINLLVNAADAVGVAGGTIRILTRRKDLQVRSFVELDVSDTGKGISAADQEKIFDPFFTTKPTGTGLGLAVVWGIVSEHDGTISVSSQAGEGTTFTLRLPVDSNPVSDADA